MERSRTIRNKYMKMKMTNNEMPRGRPDVTNPLLILTLLAVLTCPVAVRAQSAAPSVGIGQEVTNAADDSPGLGSLRTAAPRWIFISRKLRSRLDQILRPGRQWLSRRPARTPWCMERFCLQLLHK